MSDNVQINSGVGTVISTDDCGSSGHVQLIKLAVSDDGFATPLPANSTKGLYVNIAGADVNAAPHSFGYTQVNKGAFYNTTRTGTAVWTPASGKKIVIQNYQIMCQGSIQSDVQLWFGGSADTTFTRGTDYCIYDGGYTPGYNGRSNIALSGLWVAPAVDDVLRITTTAAVNIRLTVWGYEV